MRFFIIFVSSFLFANYSIQVVSGKYITTSLKAFAKLKNYPCVRIEYIDGFYTVRVGFSKNKESLIPLLERIKQFYKDSFIKRVKLDKSRIIIEKNCFIRKSVFEILKNKFKFKYHIKKISSFKTKKEIKFPTYIEYSIADIENDKYKLKELLKSKDVFYRDKVEGYIKIGEIGKAYNQIFENLNKASLDYISYRQAVDFMNYLNYILVTSSYEKSRDYKKLSFFIEDRFNEFVIYFYNDYFLDKDKFNLYELDLKYNSFLLNFNRNFFGISYLGNKNFDKLSISYELGINKKSDENLDLLKSGKKNLVSLNTIFNLNKRENISLLLRYVYYIYLNSYLGDENYVSVRYNNFIRLGYPTFNYYILYTNSSYKQKKFLYKKILPDNISSIGVGFNLGDRDLNFNNRILPFLRFFIGYDFFNRDFEYETYLGVKGRLFRKDYILFGIDYYKQLYTIYKFILNYKYYF